MLSASGLIRKVGGTTTVPSGKVGRGGALYERVYSHPPPPLPPLYLPMRLVDTISNYISSISAPPQPCARGHMFPPPPSLARHWLVQVLCYFRPVARMTGGVGDRQRPPWLLMAPPTPSSCIPPANGPEL